MTARSAAFVLLLAAVPHSSFAGNGRISGTVRERASARPVPAHVSIIGTRRAAAGDSTGRYVLLEVPPGTYSLSVTSVGYRTVVVAGVRVSADEGVYVNFLLDSADLVMSEIVVDRDRLVIDPGRTSTRSSFDGVEVMQLPMAGVLELISTSAGMYGPFIRGAPQASSRVYLDGVDITDRSGAWAAELSGFNNGALATRRTAVSDEGRDIAFVGMNATATEQGTVYAGMAPADYGTAPGVITYAHREGKGLWGGRVQLRISQLGGLTHAGPDAYNDAAQYFVTRDQLSQSPLPQFRLKAANFTWAPGAFPYGGEPSFNAEFGTGGGLGEYAGVYLSGRWSDLHGRLPNEWTRKADLSTKVTMTIGPGMRLALLGLVQDRGRILGWKDRTYDDGYRFYLQGVPVRDGFSAVGSLRLTHFLSPTTYYELQSSYSYDDARQGFCDDDRDGVIEPGEHGPFLTLDDTLGSRRYLSGGDGGSAPFFSGYAANPEPRTYTNSAGLNFALCQPPFLYEDYAHQTVSFKAALSSQLAAGHTLSLGGEIRFHRITKLARTTNAPPGAGYYNQESWTRWPLEFGVYVQDRMELGGIIATIGARIDGYEFDAADYSDYFLPLTIGGTVRDVSTLRRRKVPLRLYISPRLGVSNPLSDRASVYISMTRTLSPLPYAFLYYNYSQWVVDNRYSTRIDQPPLSSITYDLGAQWRLTEDLLLSGAAYYRDMSNAVLNRMMPVRDNNVSGPSYWVVMASGFADSRGIEASLEWRAPPGGSLAGSMARLSYTFSRACYSIALGSMNRTTCSPAEADSLGIHGQLPFDRMSSWNSSYSRIYADQSTVRTGFDRTHQISIVAGIAFPFGFRLGAVARFNSGFYYPGAYDPNLGGGTYMERVGSQLEGPWTRRVDLRLEKSFDLGGIGQISLFVDALNVFDWTNVLTYFNLTTADYRAWAERGDPTGAPGVNRPVTALGSLIYDNPREFWFGCNLVF